MNRELYCGTVEEIISDTIKFMHKNNKGET
jgi:hypothetical protein